MPDEYLTSASLTWALCHIEKFGDTEYKTPSTQISHSMKSLRLSFPCARFFDSSATRIAERQGSDDLICPAGAAEWASGVHARERAVFEFNLPVHENGIDPFG
jgi:hypothetical protein